MRVDARIFAMEAEALHRRLVGLAFAMAGDRALAEECAQEALLKAWDRVNRGEPLDSLQAWTTTVALNHCRSQLRRRRSERRALARFDARPSTDGAGHGPEPCLSAEVHEAVLALPLRQREVVVLHYLLDADVATIAHLAGISTGAVKNSLFHARKALAQRLAVHVDAEREPTEPQEVGDARR